MAQAPGTDDPMHGPARQVAPGVQVLIAPNPGPMTYTGSRTHIVGETEVAIIDPGPDDPAHLAALLRALGGRRVSHVVVTHAHMDHSGLARRLARQVNAPVLAHGPAGAVAGDTEAGFSGGTAAQRALLVQSGAGGGGEGVDRAFVPDLLLADGDVLHGAGWQLQAVHTPGHMDGHLCLAMAGSGLLFTGDHLMGWATTVISPPDGNLAAFRASLVRVLARPETTYLPGHGPDVADGHGLAARVQAHRAHREAQILAALAEGQDTPAALVARLYASAPPALHGAALRNVVAHLLDLTARGLVRVETRPGGGRHHVLTGQSE